MALRFELTNPKEVPVKSSSATKSLSGAAGQPTRKSPLKAIPKPMNVLRTRVGVAPAEIQ